MIYSRGLFATDEDRVEESGTREAAGASSDTRPMVMEEVEVTRDN